MAFKHGKNGFLLYEGFNLSRYFFGVQPAMTRDVSEATAWESPGDAKEYLSGTTGSTVSFDGRFSGDPTVVQDELAEVMGADDDEHLVLYGAAGSEVGAIVFPQSAFKTNYAVNGLMSDVVGATANFQVSGQIPYGRMLHNYRGNPRIAQNDIQTVSIPTGSGAASLSVKGSRLGAASTVAVTDTMTDAQFRTALGAAPAVRSIDNITVGHATVGGNEVFTIEFIGQLKQQDIQQITSATGGVVTDTAQQGGVALVVVSATENGTAVDNGAATTNGGFVQNHVVYASGTTKSLAVVVEDSADGSTGWATIATFATATGTTAERVPISGTIRRYTRTRVSSISGSFAFATALARY